MAVERHWSMRMESSGDITRAFESVLRWCRAKCCQADKVDGGTRTRKSCPVAQQTKTPSLLKNSKALSNTSFASSQLSVLAAGPRHQSPLAAVLLFQLRLYTFLLAAQYAQEIWS